MEWRGPYEAGVDDVKELWEPAKDLNDDDRWVVYTHFDKPGFFAGPDVFSLADDIGPFDTLEAAQACAVLSMGRRDG